MSAEPQSEHNDGRRDGALKRAGGAVRWVGRAAAYSIIGDRKAFVEERRRNFGLIRGFIDQLRSRRARRETFAEAMQRQQISEGDLISIEASLVKQARWYVAAMAIVLAVFCLLPWVRSPISHITLCVSLGGYCGVILMRVRFRLAQVRARELFPLSTWLRRFWTGAN